MRSSFHQRIGPVRVYSGLQFHDDKKKTGCMGRTYECIPEDRVCEVDSNFIKQNCKDESDEAKDLCITWQCPEGFWKCSSNECLPEEYVCDNNPLFIGGKCRDGSDEADELCSTWQCPGGYWKCGSKRL